MGGWRGGGRLIDWFWGEESLVLWHWIGASTGRMGCVCFYANGKILRVSWCGFAHRDPWLNASMPCTHATLELPSALVFSSILVKIESTTSRVAVVKSTWP